MYQYSISFYSIVWIYHILFIHHLDIRIVSSLGLLATGSICVLVFVCFHLTWVHILEWNPCQRSPSDVLIITRVCIDVSVWKLVMDREAWRVAVHGVTKSRTWLSDWTELKDQWCWAFSHVLISHSYILALYRKVYADCFTIFKLGNLSLKLLTSVFHIFRYVSYQIYDLQIFPLILLVVFSLSWWFTL